MRYESQVPASEYWSLEIDLNRDLASLMYDSLKRRGISKAGQRDPVYEYFNYIKRTIRIRPRTILKSREFSVPPEYEKALQNFEDDVRAGRDLNRYLSDKILQPAASDALLYDWNIVHFHLTRRFRPDAFAKRSDYQISGKTACIFAKKSSGKICSGLSGRSGITGEIMERTIRSRC